MSFTTQIVLLTAHPGHRSIDCNFSSFKVSDKSHTRSRIVPSNRCRPRRTGLTSLTGNDSPISQCRHQPFICLDYLFLTDRRVIVLMVPCSLWERKISLVRSPQDMVSIHDFSLSNVRIFVAESSESYMHCLRNKPRIVFCRFRLRSCTHCILVFSGWMII